MIVKLFNHPHILHQTADGGDYEIANSDIAGHIDNGGTICLEQEGRTIVINRASVPELCKLLKILAAFDPDSLPLRPKEKR
jgi:hypothetical protein